MKKRLSISSALGTFVLEGTEEALTALYLPGRDTGSAPFGESPLLLRGAAELTEYLSGRRRTFDLPLSPGGTPFQRQVWEALTAIPYGETRSYLEIARQVGNPKACRAVGMANHRNPLAIVVPCHRVVGAGGRLTGFSAGLWRKEYLLELEKPAWEELYPLA